MKKIITFFKYFNNEKTIICFTIVTILQNVLKYNLVQKESWINITMFLIDTFTFLGGGALAHHISKKIKNKVNK